jgi:hypothetical protein
MFGNQSFPNRRSKGRYLFFIPVILAVGAALGGVVMLLWNNLLPDILGCKRITFLQALGLLVLCRILFGNFGGKGKHDKNMAGRQKLREKWGGMTDDERRTFREEWRRRCGH